MKHPSGDPAREDAIRVKAYEIWLSKGCPHGTEKQDWIEAERYFQSLASEPLTTPDEHPSQMEVDKSTSEPSNAPSTDSLQSGSEPAALGSMKRPAARQSSRPAPSGTGAGVPMAASEADPAAPSLPKGGAKQRRGAGAAAPQPTPESSPPGSGRREKTTPGARSASKKPSTDAATEPGPTVTAARPRRKGAEPRSSGKRR